jgi:phosphate-selective porin O/P
MINIRKGFVGLSLCLSLSQFGQYDAVAATSGNEAGSSPADARLQTMQQELTELQDQVRQVHTQQDSPWLNERRAAEVKTLIQEVLSDADTRASLLEDGATCYYDGGFIIRDADTFLLKIGSYMQFRYLNNNASEADDDEEGGFQTRRLAMMFSGYVGSPRISFLIMPSFSRSTGQARFEFAMVKYKIDDHWGLMAGQFKGPFHREWLTSARLQPMIERSYVNAQFSSLYVQGVQVSRQGEDTLLKLTLNNGSWGWQKDFNTDRTDYAVGARGEWKVYGDWAQFKDTIGWAGDHGLLLGSAIAFDRGETGGGTATPDILKYTGDISLEGNGWNLFAAFTGRHIESNGSASVLEADQWGAVLQGGVFIVPDKVDIYARYEWLDVDGVAFTKSSGATAATDNDVAQLITIGSNYFLRGHQTKLSLDVVHAFDGLPSNDTGSGMRASDGPSTTVRGQVMVAF